MYFTESDFDKHKFTEIKQLLPEQWNQLNSTQRLVVLQDLENRISQHEKRPSALVIEKNIGEAWDGLYDRIKHTIVIDSQKLQSQPVYHSFRTLIEESRHAYQYHAIKNKDKDFHPNKYEVQEWITGLETYSSDIKHHHLYKNNPFEKHARLHSERLTNILRSEHEQTLSQAQLRLSEYSYHFEPNESGAILTLHDGRGGEVKKFLISDLPQTEIQKVYLSKEQIEGLMRAEIGHTQHLKGEVRDRTSAPAQLQPSIDSQLNSITPEPSATALTKAPTQAPILDRERDRSH